MTKKVTSLHKLREGRCSLIYHIYIQSRIYTLYSDYKKQYQAYQYNTITMLRFPITGNNQEIKMEILEHKVQILHERMKALEEKEKEKSIFGSREASYKNSNT